MLGLSRRSGSSYVRIQTIPHDGDSLACRVLVFVLSRTSRCKGARMELKKMLKKLIRPLRGGAISDPSPAGSAYGADYSHDESHSIVNDYVEFSGLALEEVVSGMQSNRSLNREAWNEVLSSQTNWDDAARAFYDSSTTYVFDLLVANYKKSVLLEKLDGFDPMILRAIRSKPGGSFLEFGGGLGVLCQVICEEGMDVTYVDIPGRVKDFAEWRFRKYELPIKVVTSSVEQLKLSGEYDVMFTDAVFEHLIDPDQALIELASHIAPKGWLILLVDLEVDLQAEPMHRKIDIDRLHGLLHQRGFHCKRGEGTFASVWQESSA